MKSAISSLVAKLARFNVAVTFFAAELLKSGVVIYLL